MTTSNDVLARLEERGVITTDPTQAGQCCGLDRDAAGFCVHRPHHPIYMSAPGPPAEDFDDDPDLDEEQRPTSVVLSAADRRGLLAALGFAAARHPNADPAGLRELAVRVDPDLGAYTFDAIYGAYGARQP